MRDGAVVSGLALASEAGPSSLFETARVAGGIVSHIGDIRDWNTVSDVTSVTEPEAVFHLAAQPVARRSYRDRIDTFATNVMGTAHVLKAARRCPSVRTIVCVTADKIYDNVEWAQAEVSFHRKPQAALANIALASLEHRTIFRTRWMRHGFTSPRWGEVGVEPIFRPML